MCAYMNAKEVAEYMNLSVSKAYEVIRQLNQELKERGYLTVRGKIPRKYFLERNYTE